MTQEQILSEAKRHRNDDMQARYLCYTALKKDLGKLELQPQRYEQTVRRLADALDI